MRNVIVLGSIFFATSVLADGDEASHVTAARVHVAAVSACVDRARTTLDEIATLSSAATEAADRADLSRRAVEVEQTMVRCIDAARQTHHTHHAARETAASQSSSASATGMHVVARDLNLGAATVASSLERVDGAGVVDDAVVRAAFLEARSRIDGCYQAFASRGGARRSDAELTFTLETDGCASHVLVEGDSARDAVFRACLENAGQSIQASTLVHGGTATFSAALRFGQR